MNSIFQEIWEELTEESRRNYLSKAKKRYVRVSKRARRKMLKDAGVFSQNIPEQFSNENNKEMDAIGCFVDLTSSSIDADNDRENGDLEVESITKSRESQQKKRIRSRMSDEDKRKDEVEDGSGSGIEAERRPKIIKNAAVTTSLPSVASCEPASVTKFVHTVNGHSQTSGRRVTANEGAKVNGTEIKSYQEEEEENNRRVPSSSRSSGSGSGSDRGLRSSICPSSSSPSSSSCLSSSDSSAATSAFSSASPSPVPLTRSLSPSLPFFSSTINGDVSVRNILDPHSHHTSTRRELNRNEFKQKHSKNFTANMKKIDKFFDEKRDLVLPPESDIRVRSKASRSPDGNGRRTVDLKDTHSYISPVKAPESRPVASPSYLSFLISPASQSHPPPHHKAPRVGSNYQVYVGSYFEEVRGERQADREVEDFPLIEADTRSNMIPRNRTAGGGSVSVTDTDSCEGEASSSSSYRKDLLAPILLDTVNMHSQYSSSNKNKNGTSRNSKYTEENADVAFPRTSEDIRKEGLVWSCSRRSYGKLLNGVNGYEENNRRLSLRPLVDTATATAAGQSCRDFDPNGDCGISETETSHQTILRESCENNIQRYVMCALEMIESHRKHRILRSKIYRGLHDDSDIKCCRLDSHTGNSSSGYADSGRNGQQASDASLPSITAAGSLCKGSRIYLRTGALEQILETLHAW